MRPRPAPKEAGPGAGGDGMVTGTGTGTSTSTGLRNYQHHAEVFQCVLCFGIGWQPQEGHSFALRFSWWTYCKVHNGPQPVQLGCKSMLGIAGRYATVHKILRSSVRRSGDCDCLALRALKGNVCSPCDWRTCRQCMMGPSSLTALLKTSLLGTSVSAEPKERERAVVYYSAQNHVPGIRSTADALAVGAAGE